MVKTMKKILATVLSLAVCLSILCVPAMASDSTAAHDFPYMLFDFEDGISFTTSSRATIVEGGMGGSGHALKIVEDNTVTSGEYQLLNKWGSNLSATIPVGHTFELSFWVKNAAPLAQMQFNIVYNVPGYPGATGNPASTDWQKITIRYTPTEDYSLGANRLRFGGLGVSTNPLAGCTGAEPGERVYLIDDFEMKILDPNAESDVDQIANLDGYRMGFENGASMRLMVPGAYHRPSEETSVTNGNETLSIVANPLGNGKVLKIDLTDAQSGNGSLALCDMKASSNNYPNAPVATVPVGSTITYTFKYYFPQEMASDNNPGFCMYHGSGTGYTEKYINSNNVKTTANEWHTAKISWTNNTEADATLKHSSFRICYSENANSLKAATLAEGETQYGNRSIYIDDIAVDVTSPADATAPISSNLIVTNDVAAGKTVRFVHTLSPASTSAAGVTDASVVRLVNTANDGTEAVINYCGVNQPMVITSIPADSKKLVFEVVPVSSDNKVGNVKEYAAVASTVSATTKGNTFPYTLFTFDDDISFATGSALSVVEGGIGGGKALQIAATSGAEWAIKDKLGKGIGITIPANHTLRISFWVKLSEADTSATFALINYEAGGYIASGSAADASSTEWQKVEINLTPTEAKDLSAGATRLRTTNLDQTILIDNFEMMIVDPNVEATKDQIANLDGYLQTFESGAGSVGFSIPNVGYPVAQSEARENGKSTIQVVDNPDGDGKVLKYDMVSEARGDDQFLRIATSTAAGDWTGYNNQLKGTIPAGATIRYQFKYYWAQEMSTDNNPGFSVYDGNEFAKGSGFSGVANEWHTATLTYTNDTEAETSVDWPQIRFCPANAPSGTWMLPGHSGFVNGGTSDFGDRTIYIDDLRIAIIPASGEITAAKSTNLEVLGTVAEGKSVWFRHTFAKASTSASDVTDDSIIRLISINDAGVENVLAICGVSEGMNIPAIPEDCRKLVMEVIPMGTDGKAGNKVAYTVATFEPVEPEEPEVVTILTQADGVVTITAAENINNAYIIFVSYTSNGQMVDYDMAYVNLSAGQSDSYEPFAEEFVTGDYTRAMLWYDLEGCVPLAKAIQY